MNLKAVAETLSTNVNILDPSEPMAEAARTTLLVELLRLVKRVDHVFSEDIEELHKARVSTRRLRSLLTLYGPYFEAQPLKPFQKSLRRLGRRLGAIRDLDVLLENLDSYTVTLEGEESEAWGEVLELLRKHRAKAQAQLKKHLEKKSFSKFLKEFSTFVTEANMHSLAYNHDKPAPYELRHVLPVIIAEQLARIRAYDRALEAADTETLHALRIEFKELRYLITAYEGVLGTTIKKYIESVKTSQEDLGRLNDIRVATQILTDDTLAELGEAQSDAVEKYIASIHEEEALLTRTYKDTWNKFNTRKTQRQLSDALLTLR